MSLVPGEDPVCECGCSAADHGRGELGACRRLVEVRFEGRMRKVRCGCGIFRRRRRRSTANE